MDVHDEVLIVFLLGEFLGSGEIHGGFLGFWWGFGGGFMEGIGDKSRIGDEED